MGAVRKACELLSRPDEIVALSRAYALTRAAKAAAKTVRSRTARPARAPPRRARPAAAVGREVHTDTTHRHRLRVDTGRRVAAVVRAGGFGRRAIDRQSPR